MGYLFDTNVWIQLLKKRAPLIRTRIDATDAALIFTCAIVKAELWHGAHKYDHPAKRRDQVNIAISPYRSLPFDDNAARHYADIRHDLETRGQIIGPNDLKIAAICRAHGVTLVTSNTDEFNRVSELQVEDWAQARA
ncbi:MAG: type II toxin-antitoxin system VapC family toxin [Prosthecobacter sp.]|nr:type II toxin-antitoxin system VapC family toxin [Prosthecobacter sp.]